MIHLFSRCVVRRHNDQHRSGAVQRLRTDQQRQAIQPDLFISRPRGGCRHFELHDRKVSTAARR